MDEDTQINQNITGRMTKMAVMLVILLYQLNEYMLIHVPEAKVILWPLSNIIQSETGS